jgi:polyferredoxin
VACGACVDACAPVMKKLRRAPRLVGHFFGEPGAGGRLLRPAALALAALTAGSFALTAAVAAARSPLEATVTGELAPRRLPSGEVWTAFTLALQNRGRAPLALRLAATAPGAELALRPDAVLLAPGERQGVQVRMVARGLGPRAQELEAQLSIAPEPGRPIPAVTRRLVVDVPEARR